MKKFAVSYISFFENVLSTRIVSAKTWKEALELGFPGFAEFLPDDMKEAKEEANNQDFQFDVCEII